MAKKQDLKRLYLAAQKQNRFSRKELKDIYGFSDTDFSVLKKRGMLLEIENKVYAVPDYLVIKTNRQDLEYNLADAIKTEKYDRVLELLKELFDLRDYSRQNHYNYILFLLNQAIGLNEPWRSVALTYTEEDIMWLPEQTINSVRQYVYRGEFLAALGTLSKLLRSKAGYEMYDVMAKPLMDICLKEQLAEHRILLEHVINEDLESIKRYLDDVQEKRILSVQEKNVMLYVKILLATKKFGVAPGELNIETKCEEDLQLAGKFGTMIDLRRREIKFKRRVKNSNIADILLVKLKRTQEDMKNRESKREMYVEPLCVLFDAVNALEEGNFEGYQRILERFFSDFGDVESIVKAVETLYRDFQKGNFEETCELLNALYLSRFIEKSGGDFKI